MSNLCFCSHQHADADSGAPAAKTRPSDLKSTSTDKTDKPRQLFWEKRLGDDGLRATNPDEIYQPWSLPDQLKPVGPPGIVSEDGTRPPTAVLASLSTSLHLNSAAGGTGATNNTSGKGNKLGTAVNGQKDAKVREFIAETNLGCGHLKLRSKGHALRKFVNWNYILIFDASFFSNNPDSTRQPS